MNENLTSPLYLREVKKDRNEKTRKKYEIKYRFLVKINKRVAGTLS
jgi:hypothetical protein